MTRLAGYLRLKRGAFVLDTPLASDEPGVTAVCGSSGAGKTSLLRCIAGLERPDAGNLAVGDQAWFDAERGTFVPAHRRAIGYVTQESSLFQHLTVRQNLAFGFKRLLPGARRISFDSVVEGLGLQAFLDRHVLDLSGGERQRVSIGRALLRSPDVLLLDEPVSALDVRSRRDVLSYLERTLQQLAVRTLYVSHDLKEAARLANEMLWMEQGRIVAQGPTRAVLTQIHLPFAELEEAESLLEGEIEEHEIATGLTRVSCAGQHLWLPLVPHEPRSRVQVLIGARDVSLALSAPADISILNVLPVRILDMVELQRNPSQVLVQLALDEQTLLARITAKSAAALALKSGMHVWALVKAVALAE